jgi:hypothetical protein
MRNPLNLLALAFTCLALGACSETPTTLQSPPPAPLYDGGHVFGSGAREDEGSTTTTTAGASTETTASDSTAARGGHVFGSGA